MENKLYYKELKCYEDADEAVIRKIGKMDFYDLALLPSQTMREEFQRYLYLQEMAGEHRYIEGYSGKESLLLLEFYGKMIRIIL